MKIQTNLELYFFETKKLILNIVKSKFAFNSSYDAIQEKRIVCLIADIIYYYFFEQCQVVYKYSKTKIRKQNIFERKCNTTIFNMLEITFYNF